MPDFSTIDLNSKSSAGTTDVEKQLTHESPAVPVAAPKTLGAGTALPIGVFATTLTTLSLSLMEWRGVTTANVFVANFFFAAAFELGFLLVSASYFAVADGHSAASISLKKGGGAFCFLAGLTGWYLTFALLLKDSIVELPLGDTSRFFAKSRKAQ
ncbi:unnamed protein product [Alternaria alternata]